MTEKPDHGDRRQDATVDASDKDDVVEYFGADGQDEGQKFVDSGERGRDDDDQTIAPG
jgi:hypothetical protein